MDTDEAKNDKNIQQTGAQTQKINEESSNKVNDLTNSSLMKKGHREKAEKEEQRRQIELKKLNNRFPWLRVLAPAGVIILISAVIYFVKKRQ